MNSVRASGGTNRGHSLIRRGAGAACTAALLFGLAAPAPAQLSTNYWALNGSGNWSAASSWSNSAIANAAGAMVFMTGLNNTGAGFGSTATVALDMDATLGYLIFGDIDRGSAVYIAENVAAPVRTLTFDTGDGKMALLSHGSGDLTRNVGNNGDYINTRILVSDPEGLYIDTFYNLTLYGGATNARALDGGGHDIVKAEDGYLLIHRIVTNVNNLVIRDGTVRFNYDNEINVNMRSDITNIVLGTPSGAIDLGELHPLQTTTNYKEGTFADRSQLPLFEVYGINNTNSAVQMTNSYNLVMNRGVVRLYSRGLVTAAQQNGGYQPGLMSGSVTLNGHENVNWIWIEAQEAVGNSLTSTITRTVFSGPITGAGGFTKYGFGEMTLTGTNDFTGRMVVGRYFDRAVGLYGGVALREGGLITGVEGITLNHSGDLYIDNRTVNIADRVNDAAWIVSRGFNKVEIAGNGSAASTETIGRVTNMFGQLSFELDRAATPQGMTLNLAGLTRTPGSTITFNSSDVAQGIFATNVNALTVNIADAGSLTQLGSGGLAGTTNRSVVQGVFGGDAVDYAGSNPNYNLVTRADEFMTLDGTRLRTLDMQT
ncbi:MAG: hypothetical protein KJ579_00635, partial [Verrucomicrobia bacterium]|nr:hypothetical protein [Verrucomicrobiota bacterium]